MTTFKISFWLGLLISSPLWTALLLRFVLPALHAQEKRLVFLFLGVTTAAVLLANLCAYFFLIPNANSYFASFNSSIGHNFWSLSLYVDYILMLMVANGFAWEIAAILFFLVHVQLLPVSWLIAKRKLMIVLAFIVGAILSHQTFLRNSCSQFHS